jgi:hypothetical protein
VSGWRRAVLVQEIEQLFLEEINLVVWQRALVLPPDVPALPDAPRRLMRVVEADDLSAAAVADALDLPGQSAFVADISGLCTLFHDITDASEIGIRLEVTDRQTCPKFHTDRVFLRMMTTYHGPGTEWLDQGEVRQAAAGEVLLAKGELWGGVSGACVHRSPPLQPGQWRVLVTLDAVG